MQFPPFWQGDEHIAVESWKPIGMKQYAYSHLRTSQIVPFQPESQVQVFGLVQLPLTHDGEQIARNMNSGQKCD